MRFRNPIVRWRHRQTVHTLASDIAAVETYLEKRGAPTAAQRGPVAFFNASTRIHTLSLNAAFGLIASWAVRSAGHDVQYWVCHTGMSPCVLGTDGASPHAHPPCSPCLELSRALYPPAKVHPLTPDPSEGRRLRRYLEQLPLEELATWEHDGLALGELTFPSVRWALRRHRLPDTTLVRSLFAGYLASAAGLAGTFRRLLADREPRALVVFNGVFYPEAVARRTAQQAGVPVITHEVGLRPSSAFFSHREATFRELEIPEAFRLTPEQDAELDEVLARRFRGEFTMAGVRFWPAMKGLPPRLTAKQRDFRQLAAVFTNVIFDTSQVHANVVFEDMFSWLDELAGTFRKETETLFVIRAHPDETRRGKESQETVAAWVRSSLVDRLDNVLFIGPDEPVSSYELTKASKFVLVYNSSVGLEAAILGTPALCAGRARFTQIDAVHAPADRGEYRRLLGEFLAANRLEVPEAQVRKARAFLFYELFTASLDLGEFLAPDPNRPGMVRFSSFLPSRLDEAGVCQVIREGILDGRPFVVAPPSAAPGMASDGGSRGGEGQQQVRGME